MKKIASIIVLALVFCGCQDDVKFNENYFQAQKDGALWRSTTTSASVSATAGFTITGSVDQETLTLKTTSPSVGTYILGTSNQNNLAWYISNDGRHYKTAIVPSEVNKITLSNAGSGYLSTLSATTTATTGTGNGLKVDITVNASGSVTSASVSVAGNGYKAGDIIAINNGGVAGNATIVIQNVVSSNGEIKITNYSNGTITGEFKFNAINTASTLLLPDVVNYQYGKFYQIPVTVIP